MKRCPYCAELDLADDALVCLHCGQNIGPGHRLQAAGEHLKKIGCALTLLMSIPVVLLLLLAGMCAR